MGITFSKLRKDIFGLFWIGVALFAGLALFSYTSTDPSFNSTGSTQDIVHNYCGYMGSFMADMLYQAFGISSWMLVLIFIKLGWKGLNGKSSHVEFLDVLWCVVILATSSALISNIFHEKTIFDNRIFIGGVIGYGLSKVLSTIFNNTGTALILWGLFFVQMLIYTEKTVPEFFKGIFNNLKFWKHFLKRFNFNFLFKNSKNSKNESNEIKKITLNRNFTLKPENQLLLKDYKSESIVKNFDRKKDNKWEMPTLDLLDLVPETKKSLSEKEIKKNSQILLDKLEQFSVFGEIVATQTGPAVTMYEFRPRVDIRISKITELADDLSLALRSESIRVIAPIPGRDVVGIETANLDREFVFLKDVLSDPFFLDPKTILPLVLGKKSDGGSVVVDLKKLPHLLVAGTTGSGKSVFILSMLTSLIIRHSPSTLKMILIDPKQVELALFENCPHLLTPPVREPKRAVNALAWAVREMDKRYRSMARFKVRGIEDFNGEVLKLNDLEKEIHKKNNDEGKESYYYEAQPYIVIVVEEFGDLMSIDKSRVEHHVIRLAQMARACGIHLVLAMQSPRRDVITGLLKTNIPGRISFKVASKMDSRIILDEGGAERLLAHGDMLFLAPGVGRPERHHAPWISEKEVKRVVEFWSKQHLPQFDQTITDFTDEREVDCKTKNSDEEYDSMYDEILSFVSTQKEISASYLQRKFRLGYPRAARVIEIFEKEGVIGPANGSKPRQVLLNQN